MVFGSAKGFSANRVAAVALLMMTFSGCQALKDVMPTKPTEPTPAPTRASRSSRAVDRHGHLFAAAVVSLRARHLLRFAFAGLFESRLLPDPAGVAQR